MSEQLELSEAQAFGSWVTAALSRSPERVIETIVTAFPESKIRAAQQAIARKPDDFAPEPGPLIDRCGRLGYRPGR